MNILNYNFFIFGAIALVLVVLIVGIVNLAFKGDKAASRSNKLMRLRVLTQFLAVIIIMIGFYLKTHK
jgi:Hypoxia induced protein conserved region